MLAGLPTFSFYGPEARISMKRSLRRTACTFCKFIEHLTPDPLHEEREIKAQTLAFR